MPSNPGGEVEKLIGARLRREREAQNRTLEDVSKKCGISIQMLHHYENARGSLSVRSLVMIARALQRPTRFFIDGQRNLPVLSVMQSHRKGEWLIEGKGVMLAGKCTQAVADAIAEIGGSADD
jgi:transcriptional regulator with XRE-family HTH domain